MTILNSPFRSKFGFSSPGFAVDALGNVIVKSIVTEADSGTDSGTTPADITITETVGVFEISTYAGTNPDIVVYRNKTTLIDLNLSTQEFFIYREDQTTQYSSGLRHSDGSSGDDALGKNSGRLSWTVQIDTPDTLFYGNSTKTSLGRITVLDPVGLFSNVTINGTTESSSTGTGALIVAGGVGIEKDVNVGGTIYTNELYLNGSGIPTFSSESNLVLNAKNKIVLRINDILLGNLDSTGLSVAINNSSINGSTIGDITPSTASFIAASVTETPTAPLGVANKTYVDSTATALAIAFGI